MRGSGRGKGANLSQGRRGRDGERLGKDGRSGEEGERGGEEELDHRGGEKEVKRWERLDEERGERRESKTPSGPTKKGVGQSVQTSFPTSMASLLFFRRIHPSKMFILFPSPHLSSPYDILTNRTCDHLARLAALLRSPMTPVGTNAKLGREWSSRRPGCSSKGGQGEGRRWKRLET